MGICYELRDNTVVFSFQDSGKGATLLGAGVLLGGVSGTLRYGLVPLSQFDAVNKLYFVVFHVVARTYKLCEHYGQLFPGTIDFY